MTWQTSTYSSPQGQCVAVTETVWRKTARSAGNGNCVEVAILSA